MRSFLAYAHRDPDRPAIVDADGTRVSYGQLLRQANQLSRAVLAAGAVAGDTVAALLPNGRHMLLAERAVTQLPLYFTPLNWHLTAGELAYILRDSAAVLLLTVTAHDELARAAAAEAGLPASRVVCLDTEAVTAGQPTDPPPGRRAGQRMLYTSGTTGRPKGVRRALPDQSPEQAAQAVVARAQLYQADHEDGRYLSVAPMYHAAPLAYAVQALDVGHTVYILGRWDAAAALDAISTNAITWTYLVPMMFTQLLALDPATRAAADTRALRSVVHTAAPCPVPVKRAMIEWLGPVLNEIYGGTEGSATFIDSADWLRHPGSVGRARANVAIRILDDEGNELPAGEIGRIFFGNAGMSFAYHNDPEKTAASRRDGFTTLGDIGFLDADGYLYLADRAADIIISGGVNIYPAEIEQALLQHPDIVDACVVGAPDPEWGERVHAAVVLRPDAVPDAGGLQAFLRVRIAGFKVPRDIDFRDTVPRSEVGKVLRRALREELWRDHAGRL